MFLFSLDFPAGYFTTANFTEVIAVANKYNCKVTDCGQCGRFKRTAALWKLLEMISLTSRSFKLSCRVFSSTPVAEGTTGTIVTCSTCRYFLSTYAKFSVICCSIILSFSDSYIKNICVCHFDVVSYFKFRDILLYFFTSYQYSISIRFLFLKF